MANEKLVTLEQLGIVKTYIDTKDNLAIKSGKFEDNKISLYTSTDKSGSAAIELDLPEEMFLDQAKTTFEPEFEWDISTYPNSEDPHLDGEPVLVLAVKGDKDKVNYSFVSIKSVVTVYEGDETDTAEVTVEGNTITVDIKVSDEGDNILEAKDDGLYVPPAEKIEIVYATNQEVSDLFE